MSNNYNHEKNHRNRPTIAQSRT